MNIMNQLKLTIDYRNLLEIWPKRTAQIIQYIISNEQFESIEANDRLLGFIGNLAKKKQHDDVDFTKLHFL